MAVPGRDPLFIVAFQSVLQLDLFRRHIAQSGKVKFEFAFSGGDLNLPGRRRLAVDGDPFNDHRRLQGIERNFLGVDNHEIMQAGKRQLAAARDDSGVLHPSGTFRRRHTFRQGIREDAIMIGFLFGKIIQFALVQANDTLRRADPQVAPAVFQNRVDFIAWQSVFCRVVGQRTVLVAF